MSIKHTYDVEEGLETKVLTKAKAIRAKCMECSTFQRAEVARCTIYTCALYPFRFGNEKGLERTYFPPEEEEEEEEEIE